MEFKLLYKFRCLINNQFAKILKVYSKTFSKVFSKFIVKFLFKISIKLDIFAETSIQNRRLNSRTLLFMGLVRDLHVDCSSNLEFPKRTSSTWRSRTSPIPAFPRLHFRTPRRVARYWNCALKRLTERDRLLFWLTIRTRTVFSWPNDKKSRKFNWKSW